MIGTVYTPNKLVGIFGGGRTGKAIALALVEMGYMVDIFDFKKVEMGENSNVKVYTIDSNSQNTIETLNLALQSRGCIGYQSIFHTFLYNAIDFEKFIEIVDNFSNHFGTIGTILTYARTKKKEVLTEQTAKPRLSDISFYGGYSKGKYQLDLAIKNYQIERPNKKFFLPKTFHIVGDGWLPGVCPPYFRDYTITRKIRSGVIELPFAGQNIYQLIDAEDLAIRIAWGIHLQLEGEYNIVNPETITAKQYYQILANIINMEVEIVDMPISEITETKIMLLDWLCDCNKIKLAIPEELSFQTYTNSLTKSVNYLQQQLEQKPSLGTARSDIWQKMNLGKMPNISHLIAPITN